MTPVIPIRPRETRAVPDPMRNGHCGMSDLIKSKWRFPMDCQLLTRAVDAVWREHWSDSTNDYDFSRMIGQD